MSPLEHAPSLIAPSLLLCLKAVVLTTAALGLRPLLESLRSKQRHRLWVVLMAGLLALPPLSYLLPSWGLIPTTHPVIAWSVAPQSPTTPESEITPVKMGGSARSTSRPRHALLPTVQLPSHHQEHGNTHPTPTSWSADSPQELAAADRERIAPASTVMIVWLVGLVALLMRLGLGHGLVWRSIRRASPVESQPELAARVARVIRRSGWRRGRQLTVLLSRDMGPATCGVLRPKILLPDTATEWGTERLEVVLLHELHHVRRHDWLLGQVAHLSAAIYWLVPPVWLARRQLEIEQERACDEAVIETGIKPSTYASHLLSLATSQRPRELALAAPSMASRTTHKQLEIRMLSILEPRPRTRLVAPILLVAFVLAIPVLAAVTTSANPPITPTTTSPQEPSQPNPPELATIVEEIEAIGRELEEYEAGMREIELESEAVERQLMDAEELAEPHFEELHNVERELAPKLEQVMAEMESQLEPYERQLAELELELEPRREQLEALEQELEETHRAAEEEISREHELAIAEHQARIEEAAAGIEPLVEELEALHAEHREALQSERERGASERREELALRREEIHRRIEEQRKTLEQELERRQVEIRRLHEEMRPRIDRHQQMMEAMEPVRERLREVHEQMQPTREEMERVARSMEKIHRQHSESMKGVHEELERRMSEVHDRLEPALERMHEIRIDMSPFHRKLEALHEQMQPIHRRLEDAHRRLDDALREEIGRVIDEVAAETLSDVSLSDGARTALIDSLRRHLSLEHEGDSVTLHGSRHALERAALKITEDVLGNPVDAKNLASALAEALSHYESGRRV